MVTTTTSSNACPGGGCLSDCKGGKKAGHYTGSSLPQIKRRCLPIPRLLHLQHLQLLLRSQQSYFKQGGPPVATGGHLLQSRRFISKYV